MTILNCTVCIVHTFFCTGVDLCLLEVSNYNKKSIELSVKWLDYKIEEKDAFLL